MNNKNGHSIYLEDALKIHAICADLNLSDDNARLLTYIHTKGFESGLGVKYFENPPKQDMEALELMLGRNKGTLRLPAVTGFDKSSQKALDLIFDLSKKIKKLDNLLESEFGMENRLTGELNARLRLYKDKRFKEKSISIYKQRIAPLLMNYDSDKIDKAFTRYREEQQRIDNELIEMTGMERK